MGSLSSTPSVPSTQVVYVPQTTATTTKTKTSSVADDVDTAALASEERSEGLLRRNRGLLGTVKTSFSGILNNADTSVPSVRKTLLGE